MTASGSPTTIPIGGTVTVTVVVSNTTAQPAALDLWVLAEQDGKAKRTLLIGSGTVPAGATATRSFDLRAPSNAPAGLYTVVVNVGSFPDTVLASDAFDVTVTGEPAGGPGVSELFLVEAFSGNVFAPDASAALSVLPGSPSVVVSPNPFSGQTTLRFELAEAGSVRLSIHDVLGREVAVLVDGSYGAGRHEAMLDGSALPAGAYLIRLEAGGTVQTRRVTLVR